MIHALLVLASLVLASAGAQPPSVGDVRTFLNRQSTIRMYIDSSPGMGHQSAAATVVRRLRELGFNGWFELVYDGNEHNLNVIATLFPGFEPVSKPVEEAFQNLPEAKMRFFRSDYFFRNQQSMSEVDLGILGGDDLRLGPEKLNVRALLTLQPTNWWKVPSLKIRYSKGLSDYDFKELNLVAHAITPVSWADVERSLNADERLIKKLTGLRALNASLTNVDLLAYYGRAPYDHWQQLGRLIHGLRWARAQSPSLFSKPIVIAVLNEPSSDVDADRIVAPGVRADYKSLLSSVGDHVTHVNVKNLSTHLERAGAGDVVLVHVGPVTEPAFQWLMESSSLPVVIRGHNSADRAAQSGRPYLGSGAAVIQHFTADTPDQEIASAQAAMVNEDVNGETAAAALGRFFLAARNPRSPLARLFLNESTARDHDGDKVVLGLKEVLRHWNDVGRDASDVNPLLKKIKVTSHRIAEACETFLSGVGRRFPLKAAPNQ